MEHSKSEERYFFASSLKLTSSRQMDKFLKQIVKHIIIKRVTQSHEKENTRQVVKEILKKNF